MFVMLNDGGALENTDLDMARRVLIQRNFIFSLLTSGVAVTLLHGAEFRDSKVCSLYFSRLSDPYVP
jgi:ATP-dependent RNA helicase DDX60